MINNVLIKYICACKNTSSSRKKLCLIIIENMTTVNFACVRLMEKCK